MKLDKIYTRTGDEGKTSLGDGSRLPKFHLRVTAYGSVDEANSVIGVANLHVEDPEVFQLLRHIQIDRFNAELEPLASFVLPGGSPASAYLHQARTVTRRAERDVVRLSADEKV